MIRSGSVPLSVALALSAACASTEDPAGVAGTLAVASVTPAANAVSAPADGDLVVSFDRPLDPASVDDGDVLVFGRWSGVVSGTAVVEGDRALRFRLSRRLSAGEPVTATVPRGALRSASGQSVRGHSWTFWVAAAPAAAAFTLVETLQVRRPGELRIQTYGAYAGDLNGDGWSDLILPNERSSDIRIFLNDGAGGYGAFEVVAVPEGDDPSTNEGADFDGDGDIDFVVGSARGPFAAVYHGDGNGGMAHSQNLDVGEAVRGVCILDFEADGDPDIAATSHGDGYVAFFHNDGQGAFTLAGTLDVADGEWSCATADANGDGLLDLFVGARGSREVVVLSSRGDGTFAETGRAFAGGDPWMLAAGDLTGDGHVDAAAVNADDASLAILAGDGRGDLSLDRRYALDGFPLAIDLGDLDGDGALDVVTSDYETGRFVLFENQGDGTLARMADEPAAPVAASCAILHDRDNDGDLDLTGIDEVDDVLLLFENR